MSKINAVRLVNINYNHNAIHISDETMHFKGQSTLISLQNGGGKSVLVQLLIAPFVQKRYRNTNDRPFASYFTTAKPSFIMVEWALENNAGYCLTGMMVRKNQNMDSNEELEIVNFVSEYKEACEQDINHLPIVENDKKELRLKGFAMCRSLFEGYKKERLNKFFCYDMNNYAQSKQYFVKLAEYGIDYREWQNIIKKINEEESGLSKLFSECKDEKGLLEKWFLDAVENKLNKDKNRMQEFRSILEKYIATYSENYNKIQQQEKLRLFQEQTQPILQQGEAYNAASLAVAADLDAIVSCLAELNRLAAENKERNTACEQELKELAEKLVRLLHEEFSTAYYKAEQKRDELLAWQGKTEGQQQQLEEKAAALEKEGHILECAELQERVDEDEQEVRRLEQRLEVQRKKNKELEPEREYIGYLLKQSVEKKIEDIQEQERQKQADKQACVEQEKHCRQQRQQLTKQLNELHSRQGRLESAILNFDDVEQAYNKKWQSESALQRNMLGEYEPGLLQLCTDRLVEQEHELAGRQQQLQQKKIKLKEMSVAIERSLQELDKAQHTKEVALLEKQQEKQVLDAQLKRRKALVRYLGLNESVLYDKERLLKEFEKKLLQLDGIRSRLAADFAELEKKYHGLQTGKTLELSDELVQMLDSLGINIVYGMEWLKNNGYAEEKKLELVKQHPFLPYALLMSAKELEELQQAEKNIFTSFPVPIILRESLTQAAMAVADRGVIRSGEVNFFVLFNDNLLDEAKLAQLLQELQREMQKLEDDINKRKDEYATYCAQYKELGEQWLTKEGFDNLQKELASLQKELEELNRQCSEAKAEKIRNITEQEEAAEQLAALDKQLMQQRLQQEALAQLATKYEAYLKQQEELADCNKAVAEAENAQQQVDEQLDELRLKLQRLMQFITELESRLKELAKELAQYAAYKESKKPASFDAALAENLDTLKARLEFILQKVSGELKGLEDNTVRAAERAAKSKSKLKERAMRFGLTAKAWENVSYSRARVDELDAEQKETAGELKFVQEQLTEIKMQLTALEVQSKNILAQMQEKCFTQEPLPKNELVEKSFAEERAQVEQQRQQKIKQQKLLQAQGQSLSENITSLAEYSNLPINKPWDNTEDLSLLSREELRRFTAELRKNYKSSQEQETKARAELLQALIRLHNSADFQEEYYKKRIELLQGLTDNAEIFLEQLATVLQAFSNLTEKLKADIALVEQEKAHIVALLEDHIKKVHEQLGLIDRNSTIKVRGHNVKMLKLLLPDWEENANIYHVQLNDLVDDITQKGLASLRKNEAITELIGKRLTTKELYDAVIGLNNVHIQLFKIEAQRELQITWRDVARNSGGEGFLSAFVILSSLLYYMRRDDTDIFADRNEGKVLLMDNPFAQTNAAHLLTPLMDMANKNNTQLISLTGLGGESIYNCYDNIYVLNLIPSKLSNISYLKSKHLAGNEGEVLSLARVEVVDEGQMDSLF